MPASTGERRELSGRCKDGSRIDVELAFSLLRTSGGILVLASLMDVTEHGRPEHTQYTTEEQLEFERYIADLAFQFINLSGEEAREAIRGALRRVCGGIASERGSFFTIGADGAQLDAVSWTDAGDVSGDGPLPAAPLVPWARDRVLAGDVVIFAALADIPDETGRTQFQQAGTQSAVVAPLLVDGRVSGAVVFDTVHAERSWPPEVLRRIDTIASVFNQILTRQQREHAARSASQEVRELKDQLQAENVFLRREERERLGVTRIIGQSASIRRVLAQIRQVAPTDSTVLLIGETGTGKELFATQIHELGPRHARPMVRVNCAAIPATLVESELFGRERGAFTGALARQAGRFELADHSTIFLDEIGDLPLEVQVKLLRVLEERTIERLGSSTPIPVDTRIIAATHRNLEQRVAEGTFREDFYYRLNVFPIHVPPLRERGEDIPLLVWRFVEEFSRAFGKRIDSIDRDNFTALQQYAWPGNIRELRNVVERAMIVATGRRLMIPLALPPAAATKSSPKLFDVEKEHIRSVLENTGWRIRGAAGAADRLGLKPTTLETRMAKLGLKRPGRT